MGSDDDASPEPLFQFVHRHIVQEKAILIEAIGWQQNRIAQLHILKCLYDVLSCEESGDSG